MFSPEEVRSLSRARERLWPEIDQAAMQIPDHIFQRILERRSATLKSLETPVQFIKKTKRQDAIVDVSPDKGAVEAIDEEGDQTTNENGCACDCPECVANDCADCSAEDCADPNCADARLSAMLKARVADAIQSWKHELPS